MRVAVVGVRARYNHNEYRSLQSRGVEAGGGRAGSGATPAKGLGRAAGRQGGRGGVPVIRAGSRPRSARAYLLPAAAAAHTHVSCRAPRSPTAATSLPGPEPLSELAAIPKPRVRRSLLRSTFNNRLRNRLYTCFV